MAVTFDIVREVISLPPDRRQDFQINDLIPWFRKKSELFRNLKTRLLVDLIKNLEFSHRPENDVIIKQGERGDCMYIILRGQVTIYINYDLKPKTNENGVTDDTPLVIDLTNVKPENIRSKLGTLVTPLGAGATFGEVALMSEDCVRTASIVTDEPTDLIIIDRNLYNRSVKAVLKAEFEEKAGFIASNPLFRNWSAKYRKQLTMALQKESYSYEECLTKQGNPVTAIYYILVGEVRLTMSPGLHATQYRRQLFQEFTNQSEISSADDSSVDFTINNYTGYSEAERKKSKKSSVEVCYLGVNEPVGDLEVLSGLNTYAQTAVCTQRTEVLVLELKHYERLLTRRNPKTINLMMEVLEMRLATRMSPPHIRAVVPLLEILHRRVEKENEAERAREIERQKELEDHVTTTPTSKEMDSFNSRGLLVDMFGPGTVFYKIRQDYEKGLLKKQKRRPPRYEPPVLSVQRSPRRDLAHNNEVKVKAKDENKEQIEADIIEEKLRKWMVEGARSNNLQSLRETPYIHASSLKKPRVSKLHYATIGMDDIKPGSKVVFRPKYNYIPPINTHNTVHDPDLPDTTRMTSRQRTKSQLAYYQMALNSTVLGIPQKASE